MKQILTLPTYAQVSAALLAASADIAPAEVHGLMCGLICASPYLNAPLWEPFIPSQKKNQASRAVFQDLYAGSTALISEFALEFSLLLPEETSDINLRTEELGLWCQGFLVGLRQGPLKLPTPPAMQHALTAPEEASEAASALQDLAEIAQVSFGAIHANEEEETALFELIEYVRLATLMLYHELRTPAVSGNHDDDLPLH